MATENQGIMSLPRGGEKAAPNAPQMGLEESYDAVSSGLQEVSPEASAAMQQTLAQITPQLDQLSDEQLDAMIQLFQYLHDHPEEYDQKVKELESVMGADTLPDTYDPEVLATLVVVFMQAKRQREMGNQREAEMSMPQPPAGMARGGIAEAARMVASKGRSGDTMLAHITKKEAAMLKKRGGVGTVNPATGLPEYGLWSSIKGAVSSVVGAVTSVVKGVINTVKSIVQSPVGKILGTIALATVLGPTALGGFLGTAGTAAVSAGTITALGGGNLKDVLKSAAIGYLGSPGGPVEKFIGNAGAAMGVTNAAGQAAINAGLVGTGVGLLTGQNLKDSVKSGLIAGAIQGGITGARAGFGAQAPLTPGDVGKQIQSGGGQAPTDFDAMSRAETARLAGNYPAGSSNNLAIGAEPPPGAQGAQGAPNVGGSPTPPTGLSRIGGGIADMAQGNFATGFEGVKGGLGDLYDKISPSAIQKEGMASAQAAADKAYSDAIAAGKPETLAVKAYDAALKAGTPGVFSTYGPMVGVGLAAAGAMGGFKPNTPPQSEMLNTMKGSPGEDLIKANPSKYLTQNLPGVEYDATGNIIGSKPWAPSATMADVRVPANSMGGGQYNFGQVQPPMGSMYTPGVGTLGQSPQIYQPYNTADMYSNLMYPRRAAEGGIMDLEDPVHMGFGGFIGRAISAIKNVINPSSRPAAAPVAQAPVAAVNPAAAPAAAQAMAAPTAAPAQGTQMSPQLAAQLAQMSPGAAAAPAANPMAAVQAAPTHFGGRMTPEMRAAFAQQFAQNMQFNPQGMQQPSMLQNLAPQPQQRFNNVQMYSNFRPQMGGQGLASLAEGGYPRRTGQISGPGTEKSDSIPAMLSDGEFVMTAKAVRGAGNGSRRAGAKKMYALMHQLERNASRG